MSLEKHFYTMLVTFLNMLKEEKLQRVFHFIVRIISNNGKNKCSF